MDIVTPALAAYWQEIHACLQPKLEQALEEPLTQTTQQLVATLEVLRVEEVIGQAPVCCPQPQGGRRRGRPKKDRRPIARAFVVKAVLDLPHTKLLIEMLRHSPVLRALCGWASSPKAIPSQATFSRAFAEFAAAGLGDQVHAALVHKHVGEQLVMHISRDATEIVAREKPAKKAKPLALAADPPLKKRWAVPRRTKPDNQPSPSA